ncbi:MAG: Rieske (2Fe-2S) protein [Cellvibrionaceae bacterium]
MPATIPLCGSEDIPDNGSKGFTVDGLQLFAVKKRGQVFVYHNRCPHAGLPLNWLPDQFLDLDRELIQCTSHGALFRIDTGRCVAGPCPGQHLRAVECRETEGQIYIDWKGLHEGEEPS